MTNTSKTFEFTCGKCDGKGRLSWAMHRDNGRCYWCGGSGTITGDSPRAGDALKSKMNGLYQRADMVLWGAAHDRLDYSEGNARYMLDDLFAVGTDNAREILNYLAAGRFYDSSEDRHCVVPRADAVAMRTLVIELGRKAKAAKAAA